MYTVTVQELKVELARWFDCGSGIAPEVMRIIDEVAELKHDEYFHAGVSIEQLVDMVNDRALEYVGRG